MIITYHGQAFVKLQQGDLTLAFNPISKDSKSKPTRFGADIALISLNEPDFNGLDEVSRGDKVPFAVTGPGEYEVNGIFIQGFSSLGDSEKINTIYTVTLDGIRLCHLGAIKSSELDADVTEEIGAVDVLFVPIGGGTVLSPKEAAKLATSFESKIVIPVMAETSDKDGGALKLFMKELGGGETTVDKLTIKKKDLEGKEGELVIIKQT